MRFFFLKQNVDEYQNQQQYGLTKALQKYWPELGLTNESVIIDIQRVFSLSSLRERTLMPANNPFLHLRKPKILKGLSVKCLLLCSESREYKIGNSLKTKFYPFC